MCENCNNLFDVKNNLPYILPCGHSLCEKCLISIEFKDNKNTIIYYTNKLIKVKNYIKAINIFIKQLIYLTMKQRYLLQK